MIIKKTRVVTIIICNYCQKEIKDNYWYSLKGGREHKCLACDRRNKEKKVINKRFPLEMMVGV